MAENLQNTMENPFFFGTKNANTFNQGGFGGTGGSGSSQSYANTYLDPKMVKGLAKTLGGTAEGASSSYLPFIQDPTSHPLFQKQLSGLLQSLQPQEDASRRNTLDMLRASGMSNSSTGANAINNNESQIRSEQQRLGANVLGQSFSQIVQALMGPQAMIPNLINALKLNYGTGQSNATAGGGSSGWENIPPSLGLNTPMAGNSMPSTMSPHQLAMASGQSSGGGTLGPNAGTPEQQLQQLIQAMQGGGGGQGPGGIGASFAGSSGGYIGNQAVGGTGAGGSGMQQQPASNPWEGWTEQDWQNLYGE